MKNIEELKKIKDALEVLINESEKPKFEVGKWYKSKVDKALYCIKEFNGFEKYGRNYGFYYNGEWMDSEIRFFNDCRIVEATPKEVEEALEKEAVKRGFKEGSRIKDLQTGKIKTLKFKELSFYSDILCDGYGCAIFENGIWAEIVKTKTIDEIARDLSALSEYGIINYMSSTENKQTIIETLNNL